MRQFAADRRRGMTERTARPDPDRIRSPQCSRSSTVTYENNQVLSKAVVMCKTKENIFDSVLPTFNYFILHATTSEKLQKRLQLKRLHRKTDKGKQQTKREHV